MAKNTITRAYSPMAVSITDKFGMSHNYQSRIIPNFAVFAELPRTCSIRDVVLVNDLRSVLYTCSRTAKPKGDTFWTSILFPLKEHVVTIQYYDPTKYQEYLSRFFMGTTPVSMRDIADIRKKIDSLGMKVIRDWKITNGVATLAVCVEDVNYVIAIANK